MSLIAPLTIMDFAVLRAWIEHACLRARPISCASGGVSPSLHYVIRSTLAAAEQENASQCDRRLVFPPHLVHNPQWVTGPVACPELDVVVIAASGNDMAEGMPCNVPYGSVVVRLWYELRCRSAKHADQNEGGPACSDGLERFDLFAHNRCGVCSVEWRLYHSCAYKSRRTLLDNLSRSCL